jgi:threonine synthase
MDEFKTSGYLDLGTELLKKSQQWVYAAAVTTDEVLSTIKHFYEEKYLLDPHSAVGVRAVQKLKTQRNIDPNTPLICLATAHACKFADSIKKV